ncbi:MAG: HAMP domain-containing sensor histidine kinase [Rhizomicrobium sp.]|jgi:signal transduction histidine kinase
MKGFAHRESGHTRSAKPINDIPGRQIAEQTVHAPALQRTEEGAHAPADGTQRERPQATDAWRARLRAGFGLVAHSLSGRLLLLTLVYVLVTEVLIMVPSLGGYYRSLLEARVESAEIAVLPFTEVDVSRFSGELQRQLVARAGADAVMLRRHDVHTIYLNQTPTHIDQDVYLSDRNSAQDMYQALTTMAFGGNRTLRLRSPTHVSGAEEIEVVLNESTIRDPLLSYAAQLVLVALAISLATAILVFASLYIVFVRPMRRLTLGMVEFQENPDDPARIVAPSTRKDEIGLAERELSAMQRTIYSSLQQRARLAALGTAVAKIQHDLRNMLSTAQLASDRLSALQDPVVQKLAPRLVSALGHAVALATNTLRYGRADEQPPQRRAVNLSGLVEEVREAAIVIPDQKIDVVSDIDPALDIHADPEQLFRVLLNLVRNAAEALVAVPDARIAVSARREDAGVTIDIADNGAGMSDAVRARLFQPFALSTRPGGTGLGLAIARELARAHGGDVVLVSTGSSGTVFRVTIPERS